MMSNQLLKAREYELEEEKKINSESRPVFHLSTRTGWMNDPNGFSFYNGEYHMFYQYHPYDTNWGPMHWGHATSKDLLNWDYLPASLAPDQNYDEFGCFSGSAITLENGKQLLMYTGVAKSKQDNGATTDIQTQCLAVGDGINYKKYEANPVLTEKDLPENASKVDFRDPKIWLEKDGSYRCVVASRDEDGDGQILLFSSKDGFQWKYEQVLIKNNRRFGKMWECPDFFELDGKWVLLTSPQDMQAKKLEYINGNGTLSVIGTMDHNRDFVEEVHQSIDYGIDFYAPQTTLMPDGRRVMIGWMQNWDTCSIRGEDMRWFGQMSIPRELSIQNNKLIQKPIQEIELLHRQTVVHKDIMLSKKTVLEGVKGRVLDMTIEVNPVNQDEIYQKFSVCIAENEHYHTAITYYPAEHKMKMNRSYSGVRRATMNERTCVVSPNNGKLNLRVIVDRYSVEVFINHGEQVMSMVIFTEASADGISFTSDGKAKINVTKSEIQM